MCREQGGGGVASEVSKNGLGDFLGELQGADLPERSGMDEINVAADEFGEGVFGAVAGVAREQLQVGFGRRFDHCRKCIAAEPENPTKLFVWGTPSKVL